MNDREKWNKLIADNTKVQEILNTDDSGVLLGYLNERMETLMTTAFTGSTPMSYEDYQNTFYDYKSHKNLYVMLKKGFKDKAEAARKKLDELDAIESASQF